MMKKILFATCFTSLIAFGCGTEELFTQEEVFETLNECRQSPLTNGDEIEKNLIGTWDLVGYDCGFCAPNSYELLSVISLEEGQGTIAYLENGVDSTFNFTWNIEESKGLGGEAQFLLRTDPISHYLSMHTFCDNYMIYDHRPVDGPMFLYEKR